MEKSSGNTKPRISQSKYWCFTSYNLNMEQWIKYFESYEMKYIIGEETCPTTGRKHLQGYIESETKFRPLEKFKEKDVHWEKRKGNREQNIKYCSKEGRFKTNFTTKKPIKVIENLYPWQQDLVDSIPLQNDRQILWIYDEEGCAGKTAICKYLVIKHNALVLSGKSSDIKYGVASYIEEWKNQDEFLFIFHFVRSQEQFVSYQAIEEVKDGMFFSSKYESKMVCFNNPKIIVFANFKPDKSMLSRDRWIIHKIDPKDL